MTLGPVARHPRGWVASSGQPPPLEGGPVRRLRLGLQPHHLALSALTLLGLALRMYVVWRANGHAPNDASRLFGDEPEYNDLALGLLQGRWFAWPARLPLYPTFVAAVHWLSGESYDMLFYVQAILGALTVIPAYVLTRDLLGRSAALLAAFGVAVHWSLVIHATRELSEILYTPALLVAMIALVRAMNAADRRWRLFAAAGALLGIATLVRPAALLFPLFVGIALLLAWRSWRPVLLQTAVLAGAMGLVTAPWMVSNAIQYRTVLPLSTSVGALWQGSPEYYDLAAGGRSYLSIWRNELHPSRNGGHHPGSIEGDRYFTRRALVSIRARPATYAWYSTQKVAWYWIGHPSADWFGGTVLSPGALSPYWAPWEVMMMMATRLLPLAGVVATWLLRRRWREILPVYALLVYFTLLHALTWAESRLSEPLAPYVIMLVAGAVVLLGKMTLARYPRLVAP